MTSPRSLPTSLCCLPVSSLKVVVALDNYSLVFVIFINFFRQLKDWVGQVLFLVSCPKGQVEKYVNVETCTLCLLPYCTIFFSEFFFTFPIFEKKVVFMAKKLLRISFFNFNSWLKNIWVDVVCSLSAVFEILWKSMNQ